MSTDMHDAVLTPRMIAWSVATAQAIGISLVLLARYLVVRVVR